MSAIVTVESHGNPNAIHDNTTDRSYFPAAQADAITLASGLVAAGHSVDLGLAQINSGNLPGLGLTVADMFDPCTNLRAGSRILSGDYSEAVNRFGPGQYAALRAIGAYNTGRLTRGDPYIRKVLDAYIAGGPPHPAPVPALVTPPPAPVMLVTRPGRVAVHTANRAREKPQTDPADASVLVPLGGMSP